MILDEEPDHWTVICCRDFQTECLPVCSSESLLVHIFLLPWIEGLDKNNQIELIGCDEYLLQLQVVLNIHYLSKPRVWNRNLVYSQVSELCRTLVQATASCQIAV